MAQEQAEDKAKEPAAPAPLHAVVRAAEGMIAGYYSSSARDRSRAFSSSHSHSAVYWAVQRRECLAAHATSKAVLLSTQCHAYFPRHDQPHADSCIACSRIWATNDSMQAETREAMLLTCQHQAQGRPHSTCTIPVHSGQRVSITCNIAAGASPLWPMGHLRHFDDAALHNGTQKQGLRDAYVMQDQTTASVRE